MQLTQIHIAMDICGKGYVTMIGKVATVTAAVQAGAEFIRSKGLLVNKVVISQPRAEVLDDKI